MCESDISVNFIHLNKLISNQRILCTNATMVLNRQFPKLTQYLWLKRSQIPRLAERLLNPPWGLPVDYFSSKIIVSTGLNNTKEST